MSDIVESFNKLSIKCNAKPFIKWVGGKTQIIEHVLNNFPKNISHYYEPFVGGGSVLIEVLNSLEEKKLCVRKVCASDINWSLINCYKIIKKHHEALLETLDRLKSEYDEAEFVTVKGKREKVIVCETIDDAKSKGKHHVFYYYRQKYNKLEKVKDNKIELAALFIFLNKTCFRGLYREGKNGFNVPYGNYNSVSIDIENIKVLNVLFNKYNVKFKVKGFEKVINKCKKDDFIYLDPPYYPEKETSFVDYVADGFTMEDHRKLVEYCKNCKNRFLLSNSNSQYIKDNLKDLCIKEVLCKRHINAKKPGSTCLEVLVSNFFL